MQYNRGMPTREALIIEAGGELFRFYYDLEAPEVLHITLRHGTTPRDAIRAFFEGESGSWNQARQRFETISESHGLYLDTPPTRPLGDRYQLL